MFRSDLTGRGAALALPFDSGVVTESARVLEARATALIVEDEPAVAELLAATLAQAGYATTILQGCDGLVDRLGRRPDLVVLDVSLRDADAVDVLRTLAGQSYRGSVLLVSAASARLLRDIWRIGADRGLVMLNPVQKPFRSSEILGTLTHGDGRTVDDTPVATGKPDSATSIDCAEALRSGWLETWYQPKVSTRTGRIVGAECLARVRHPTRSVLTPDCFLPSADADCVVSLTSLVLRQSCLDWHDFAAVGVPLLLAVNIPTATLASMPLVTLIRDATPANRKWPGLILEITEDEAMKDPAAIRELAVQLSIYGVGISLDDFGTGYSNLSRVHELPCREIKIDKSLVRECGGRPKSEAICRAIIAMAAACGAEVVAEGVETAADLALMTELGCQTVQGYFVGRPMPKNLFLERLKRTG